ncbi:hypothetical protein T440DRAFT_518729 [Plenodomus tracheiphilus IPT5]|uniref:Uncharacterized protein n=1 Tax=Plenodomus tracheiphilus IPT5 TaxID=1408161 RepID=A0A6A7B2Y3_9PLEO|nr:hypothetical protein T440DRAFT_518729 [Plenodomus tracheiphilus IPT5]
MTSPPPTKPTTHHSPSCTPTPKPKPTPTSPLHFLALHNASAESHPHPHLHPHTPLRPWTPYREQQVHSHIHYACRASTGTYTERGFVVGTRVEAHGMHSRDDEGQDGTVFPHAYIIPRNPGETTLYPQYGDFKDMRKGMDGDGDVGIDKGMKGEEGNQGKEKSGLKVEIEEFLKGIEEAKRMRRRERRMRGAGAGAGAGGIVVKERVVEREMSYGQRWKAGWKALWA